MNVSLNALKSALKDADLTRVLEGPNTTVLTEHPCNVTTLSEAFRTTQFAWEKWDGLMLGVVKVTPSDTIFFVATSGNGAYGPSMGDFVDLATAYVNCPEGHDIYVMYNEEETALLEVLGL